jgi:ATP-binding cassette subfamily F protein 3
MKLQVSNISKSYGVHDILSSASLQVKNNEKIGLVGRNGCGKTTLLKIISRQEDPDKGEVMIPNSIQVGSLSQQVFDDLDLTVQQALEQVFAPLKVLEKQLHEQAQVLETDHSQKALDRYDAILHEFEAKGGYDYDYELKNVFFHFGFEEEDLSKKLSEFSSGQRTRIALVRMLLEKPDVLLLDEPTNHLDVDSIEWLENYISHYPSAVIVVSHDRMFLDRVCDEIVEIEHGKTMRFAGNYSHYVKAKEDWIAKNHSAWLRQQQEIARMEQLIERFRYKASKASFAQSKIKYLERMEKIEDVQADQSTLKARFSSGRKGGNKVLETDHLVFGYDTPLSQVTFDLYHGQRMGIVGPNGAGKSTLLKTIMGKIPALSGDFIFGHQIDTGYFDQESTRTPSDRQVINELWDAHPQANQTEIRNVLASFLFTQNEVFKDVQDLSGGERVCLALAGLMMDHDNFLILDEPTNHLDIPAREALEKALENYDGTLLFVSHDRMFLSKMAERILEVGPVSTVYPMGYTEYSRRKKEGTLVSPQKSENPKVKKENTPVSTPAMDYAKQKQLSNRVVKLEQLLEEAEKEKERLEELRYDPEYYSDYKKTDELEEKIAKTQQQIEDYMSEWEEKMALLENK